MPAAEGIMSYDTLTVYGNIELRANFDIANYPIHYYLNGASEIEENPDSYTYWTNTFTLKNPTKDGDKFLGWVTGTSDNETPQLTVTVPLGTTGEQTYFAVFERSGSEVGNETVKSGDAVWAAGSDSYMRIARAGSVVRIYNTEGTLYRQFTAVSEGTTVERNMPKGIYIVTINNEAGKKIRIE